MTSFKQKDSVKVDCLYTEQFIDKSKQILYISFLKVFTIYFYQSYRKVMSFDLNVIQLILNIFYYNLLQNTSIAKQSSYV